MSVSSVLARAIQLVKVERLIRVYRWHPDTVKETLGLLLRGGDDAT